MISFTNINSFTNCDEIFHLYLVFTEINDYNKEPVIFLDALLNMQRERWLKILDVVKNMV